MSALKVELQTYTEKLPQLLSHVGKYVVIKGAEVVDTFDSYQDALTAGYQKFALEPFLVKKIAPIESISYFTRDFGATCQV